MVRKFVVVCVSVEFKSQNLWKLSIGKFHIQYFKNMYTLLLTHVGAMMKMCALQRCTHNGGNTWTFDGHVG